MSKNAMPLKIGDISIWPPVISAPLAGYTDRVFRDLLRELGCPYCYTEMVSAKGLIYGGDNSREILRHTSHDAPLAVQLFGSEPESMGRAAALVKNMSPGFQVVDINMGCPARKVTSQGAGGALLLDLHRAEEVIRAVKSASKVPVTAKIRLGWDSPLDLPSVAARFHEAGLEMLAVHGRTVTQGYSGKADWSPILEAQRAISFPIVGNGDVTSPEDAVRYLESGQVSGVMIGRAALQNPLIFRECRDLLETGGYVPASPSDRLTVAMEHFRRSITEYGERRGLLEMRKHLAFYLKGLRGASRLRERINREQSPERVLEILEEGRLMSLCDSQ